MKGDLFTALLLNMERLKSSYIKKKGKRVIKRERRDVKRELEEEWSPKKVLD